MFRLPWMHPDAGVFVEGWVVAVLVMVCLGSGGCGGRSCATNGLGWWRLNSLVSLSIHQTSQPGGQSGGTGSGLGTVAVGAGAVEGAACGSASSSSSLRNDGCLL